MDKPAVDDAVLSLTKATKAIKAMDLSNSFAEMESAWSDFLMPAARIFSKLEQGAKSNPKSVSWFGSVKHTRRTDPLLRYIRYARNVDYHGLTNITERVPGSLAIKGNGIYSGVINGCVYRKPKSERSGDEVRPRRRANL